MRILLLLAAALPAWGIDLIRNGARTANAYPETCAGVQSALNAAIGGDVLELTGGALYNCGTTTITLPRHPGSGGVVVRSSKFRNLPDGNTRICPPGSTAHSGAISHPCAANIASSGGAPGSSGGDLAILQWGEGFAYGVGALAGASDWYFLGIEFRGTGKNPPWSTLLAITPIWNSPSFALASRSQRITIDRCWVHGYLNAYGPQRAIIADGSGLAIINNVIEEFKQYDRDGQGIGSSSGPGPYLIKNNFLAGGAENSMTGGGGSAWPGSIPSFWTYVGNYSTRDQRWWITISGQVTAQPADPTGAIPAPNGNFSPTGSAYYWQNSVTRNWFRRVSDGTWTAHACGGTGQPACPAPSPGSDPAGSCTPGRVWLRWDTLGWFRCEGAVSPPGPPTGTWTAWACGSSCPNYNAYPVLKNLYEHKVMRAARVEGNLFDGYWNFQQFDAILLYNAAQTQNHYTYSLYDLGFRYNVVSRSGGGISFGNPGGQIYAPLARVFVEHNLLDDIADTERMTSNASAMTLKVFATAAPYGVTLRHNTHIRLNPRSGSSFTLYSGTDPTGTWPPTCPYCLLLDNVLEWGSASSPITGDGQPNAAAFFGTGAYHSWDNGRATGNVFSKDGQTPFPTYTDPFTRPDACCGGNYIANLTSDVLVQPGVDNRVSAAGTGCGGASCQGKATDGGDPGADIATLTAMTAHAADGQDNPYLRFRVASWRASASGATVDYEAPAAPGNPDGACTVKLSPNESLLPQVGTVTEAAQGTVRRATVDGLAAGQLYYYAVQCGQATQRGALRTRVQ